MKNYYFGYREELLNEKQIKFATEIECIEVKRNWVNKFMPFVTEFNAQSYGTPKQNAIQKRAKIMYLLDDNKEVCEMWKTEKMRKSVNVNRNGLTTIEALEKIYTELTK